MGLVVSSVIAYAGVNDALACMSHLLSGFLLNTDPDFDDLVKYYTSLLRQADKQEEDWTAACGQGYLNLTQDTDGHLKSAAVKYYHGHQPDSTAILFSTKISSFGDSVDSPQSNGNFKNERYSPAKTKTIVTNTSNSFSINNRNKSPGPDRRTPVESIDRAPDERVIDTDTEKETEKLTWQYTPLSTPEIQLQSYDDDKPGVFTEEYLRSLDGIKHRPLQRSDPSGRRRSFRKHRSSSSTSSKDSRASREEELKIFTSLEEAELTPGNQNYGSAPNLSARSYSRSRSREPRNENSVEADSAEDLRVIEAKKLDSFDEEPKEEVIEDEVDFWGNSDD